MFVAFLMLLCPSVVWAEELPAQIPKDRSGIVFLARLQLGQPQITLRGKLIPLVDNGAAPDAVKEDGVWTAFVVSQNNVESPFVIQNKAGQQLWAGTLPEPSFNQQTWVTIQDNPGDTTPNVTIRHRRLENPSAFIEGQLDAENRLFIPLVAASLAFLLAWLLRRPFRPSLRQPQRAAALPASWPQLLGTQQIWTIDEESKLIYSIFYQCF